MLFIVNNENQLRIFSDIVECLKRKNSIFLKCFLLQDVDLSRIVPPLEIDECFNFANIKESKLDKLPGIRILRLLRLKRVVEKAILRERPDLVVLGNDYLNINCLFIHAAKMVDIPTLLIQDGITMPSAYSGNGRNRSSLVTLLKSYARKVVRECEIGITSLVKLRFLAEEVDGQRYGACGCSMVSVFGDTTKDLLIKRGVSPARIKVTGAPGYDRVIIDKEWKGSFIDKPVFCKDRPNIIWANEIMEFEPIQKRYGISSLEQYFKNVFYMLGNLKEYNFLVKLHPDNSKELFEKIWKIDQHKNIQVIQDCQMLDLLRSADGFIASHSTTILEALLMRVPVAIIDFFSYPSSYLFQKEIREFVILIKRIDDIGKAVKQLLERKTSIYNNNRFEKYLHDNLYQIDGMASERCCNLIRSMLGL